MDSERRKNKRFPVRRDARYSILEPYRHNPAVATETLDISSGGMRLLCANAPAPGSRMDVSVNWPAELENGTRLKLFARTRVVWTANGVVGVLIERYEFRTQGKEAKTLTWPNAAALPGAICRK